MSQINLDLYIDESGDFEAESKSGFFSPSLVGGLLIPSKVISDAYLNSLVSSSVHAMEEYDKDQIFFAKLKKCVIDQKAYNGLLELIKKLMKKSTRVLLHTFTRRTERIRYHKK